MPKTKDDLLSDICDAMDKVSMDYDGEQPAHVPLAGGFLGSMISVLMEVDYYRQHHHHSDGFIYNPHGIEWAQNEQSLATLLITYFRF